GDETPVAPAPARAAPDGDGAEGRAAVPVAADESPANEAPAPENAWFELPDPDHVAPVVEWVEALPQGDASAKRKRGARSAHVPVGAPSGWWLRLTSHVMEALADAWDVRPRGVRWYADAGASGLFRTRHAVPRVRVAPSGMDWFTVSAEWQ